MINTTCCKVIYRSFARTLGSILVRLMTIALLISSIPASAVWGAGTIPLKVTPSATNVIIGDEVIFTVSMGAAEGTNFSGFGYRVSLPDGMVLKAGSAAVMSAFKPATGMGVVDFDSTLLASGFGEPYNGSGLDMVRFTCVAEKPGRMEITLTDVEMLGVTDSKVILIPAPVTPAYVTVNTPVTDEGGSGGDDGTPRASPTPETTVEGADKDTGTPHASPTPATSEGGSTANSDTASSTPKPVTDENSSAGRTGTDTTSGNTTSAPSGGSSTGTSSPGLPSFAPSPRPSPETNNADGSKGFSDDPTAGGSTDVDWANPFADVGAEDWFYGDVAYMYANKLMVGTSDDMFAPDMSLTRAEVVTVLYRLNAADALTGGSGVLFTDVAVGEWYADAIKWASEAGIAEGYGDGRFGPNDVITREQLVTVLDRYAAITGIALPETRAYAAFADQNGISGYAAAAVERFYMAGIVNGKPENKFDPTGESTHAEFAAVMHRFLLRG